MSSNTNVNKVILVGNLGANPILRQTASGNPVANLSVATNRAFKLADGTVKESTVWHRVVVWGKRAEACHRYVEKGNRVYLEGTLQSHSWTDKEGQQRWKMEVLCNDIKFLSMRPLEGTELAELPTGSESESEQHAAPTDSLH